MRSFFYISAPTFRIRSIAKSEDGIENSSSTLGSRSADPHLAGDVDRLVQSLETPEPLLRIRIRVHRIHVFLGLLDPDPDPFVRGMDPNPATIRFWILLSLSKNSKENFDFYCFVTSF
jgi:hypothetical protein